MHKAKLRKLRHHRVRAKVFGTAQKPRLNVYRSLTHIYAQLIDDTTGQTLVAASSKDLKQQANKTALAGLVGQLVGQKALKAGITQVVFDRGGYQYHGRVKNLAEGARQEGLKF